MKIDIENKKQLLSHFLLSNSVVYQITETDEFKNIKDDEGMGSITATVFFNDIEIPAQDFEETLQELFEQVNKYYANKYDAENLDAIAEERAKEMMNDYINNLHSFENYTSNLVEKFPAKF